MDHAAAGSHGARHRERPPVTLLIGDAALAARRAVVRPGASLAPLADAPGRTTARRAASARP